MAASTYSFTPYWLNTLPPVDADEVRTWLTDLGVNTNLCPGFDYDGEIMTTRYYQTNEMGSAMMSAEGPIFESRVREFRTRTAPPAVRALMIASRDA